MNQIYQIKTVTTNRITSRDDRKVISHKEKAADILNTFFVNTENILKIDKDKRLLAEMNDVFDTVLKVIKNNRNYGTIDIYNQRKDLQQCILFSKYHLWRNTKWN